MSDGNKQRDIVSGVGVTALAVAAGRAIESHRPDGLVDDPLAEAFVRAARAHIPMPTRPTATDSTSSDDYPLWPQLATCVGLRSKFFDDFFVHAADDGIRQAVVLASGLDTRAFRLAWPSEMVLFEIDQPTVLEFKNEVLREQKARPRVELHAVPIDLREEWATELRAAGFDRTRPTAWLAEGLLPYLPVEAERELFTWIEELSAPLSQLAVEHAANIDDTVDDPEIRAASRELGIELERLVHTEDKPDPSEWLTRRGWDVTGTSAHELARRYHREIDPGTARLAEHTTLLLARRLP